jgi:HK97 family phage portal protein
VGLTQTLRNLDARLSRAALSDLEARKGIGYPNPGWAPTPIYGSVTATGVSITEERANTVAAWYAGVRKISQDVAKAPLHTYRRNGRVTEKATDDPMYELLHDAPNPEMTSMVFRETLQSHALAWGNGYAEKELSGTGRTLALWPLRPDRMEVTWEGFNRVYWYSPTATAAPIRMSSDRIYHLPGLGFDGLKGYAVLRLARETLGAAIALRDYGNRVVKNDARPGMVLHHPGTLSDPARDTLKRSWVEANERDGAGRTALLEEGITLSTVGFPPEDIQFLESQQWQVSEVARWLDIAPHKIGDLSRATFSNIEEQNLDHVTSTLGAWFVRWEQQLNKDVVPRGLFCEHNLDAQLRGRTLERAQANVLKINARAMVPNEWRAQDNQNPVEWGDAPVATPNNQTNPWTDLGTLIRAGFEPEAAAIALGITPIAHTGLVPITVGLDPETLPPPTTGGPA